MKELVKKIIRVGINLLGLNKPFLPYMWLSDQVNRIVRVDEMIFDANSIPAYYRGRNAKYGEKDTITWIEKYVKKDDIFFDIGANAGTFTILPAITKGAKVIAFEPEAQNYSILNHNIFLNNLSSKVVAYNIAVNDTDMFSVLNLSKYRKGGSSHNFEEIKDPYHKEFTPAFKQGVFGMSLDSFVFEYDNPFPNHIKVDVDGNEYRIVRGMKKLLSDSRLKSIAIELNPVLEVDLEVIKEIEGYGFKQILHPENSQVIINYFFIRM